MNNEYMYSINIELDKLLNDTKLLNMIENSITYFDNIINIPSSFIKQEEELIPIEQSKKITPESIKHLAKHANYINKKEATNIMPIKILNTNNVDNFVTYENRFIYTLLIKLKDTLEQILYNIKIILLKDSLTFKGSYKFNKDIVDFDIKININKKTSNIPLYNKNRIKTILDIVYNYMHTPFINKLKNIELVKSPLVMTNILTKNKNYTELVNLYNYIEKYNTINKTHEKKSISCNNNKLINEFLQNTINEYFLFKEYIKRYK